MIIFKRSMGAVEVRLMAPARAAEGDLCEVNDMTIDVSLKRGGATDGASRRAAEGDV